MWCVNHNTNYECKGRITYVQKCTLKYEDKSKRKKERKGEGKKVIGKKRKKKKVYTNIFSSRNEHQSSSHHLVQSRHTNKTMYMQFLAQRIPVWGNHFLVLHFMGCSQFILLRTELKFCSFCKSRDSLR